MKDNTISQHLKDLRALAKDIGFSGFANHSQRQFLELITNYCDLIEEKLK